MPWLDKVQPFRSRRFICPVKRALKEHMSRRKAPEAIYLDKEDVKAINQFQDQHFPGLKCHVPILIGPWVVKLALSNPDLLATILHVKERQCSSLGLDLYRHLRDCVESATVATANLSRN